MIIPVGRGPYMREYGIQNCSGHFFGEKSKLQEGVSNTETAN
jgi:hypothetical protein